MERPDPRALRQPAAPIPEEARRASERAGVVIAGGGLVGLTLAIDLLRHGIRAVVLEKRDLPSEGSRSICQAKRTLEIWDRLAAAAPMLEKGVTWKVGAVCHGERLLYRFDLLPEHGHKMPAFINLQQYYVEQALLERLLALGGSVRWCHELTAIEDTANGVAIEVQTPQGTYRIEADWLVDCEGVRSRVRRQLALDFEGEVFQDKFLICDIKLERCDFPPERWFWFEPPFHNGQTALRHRQADDVWRIDLQLWPDADPDLEREPERVRERIRRMLGHDRFSIEWVSVYVFQCRMLERFVHGRVVFAGDSAHQVSPFGARGGNGGVQDADNLAWKLARVLRGESPPRLIDSYDFERQAAARENILNSTRATNFMSPKSPASRVLRDATLGLAARYGFARALINPGRLSVPAQLRGSPLNTEDVDRWATGAFAPGSPALDAPVRAPSSERWLLELLRERFTLLVQPRATAALPRELETGPGRVSVLALDRDLEDTEGLVRERYQLIPGSAYLIRPDQHVAGRWQNWNPERVAEAMRRATEG